MSKRLQMRMCMGCGHRASQGELLRLFIDAQGHVTPNLGPRAAGRGGYLHRDDACCTRFASRKGLVRSLGCALSRAQRQAVVARLRAESEL